MEPSLEKENDRPREKGEPVIFFSEVFGPPVAFIATWLEREEHLRTHQCIASVTHPMGHFADILSRNHFYPFFLAIWRQFPSAHRDQRKELFTSIFSDQRQSKLIDQYSFHNESSQESINLMEVNRSPGNRISLNHRRNCNSAKSSPGNTVLTVIS